MDNKNQWTIVQNSASLKYYSYEAISQQVLEAFDQSFNSLPESYRKRQHLLLKLLECYLQISNQRIITLLEFSHPQFYEIALQFCGALYSDRFCNLSMERRSKFFVCFLKLLRVLKSTIPELRFREFNLHNDRASDEVKEAVKYFEAISLNEERIYYWRSWWTKNKKGTLLCLPLNSVYCTYGRAFTDRLFRAVDECYGRSTSAIIPCFPQFCEWLSKSGYRLQDFNNPETTLLIFQLFCWHYFSEEYRKGGSVNYLILSFKCFIKFSEDYLIETLFAEPLGCLPCPEVPRLSRSGTRIRKNNAGIEVKEKLLTDVPLNVTDDKAIEFLFDEIHADLRHVIAVAKKEANCLWGRYRRRQRLAVMGFVRDPGSKNQSGVRNGQHWLVSRNNRDRLANICATFEQYGFTLTKPKCKRTCYGDPVRDSAYQLGLPTSYTLIPLFALLVYEHPNITSGMIKDFELYDKNGNQRGFVRLDGGWVLDMRKDRRRANNSQVVISLTSRAAAYVRRAILITDCVRQHFKSNGDDRWRYLWLNSGSSFSPSKMRQYTFAKVSTTPNFYHALQQPTADISIDKARALSKRFDLGTLRASRGIQIYLQTRDVTKMSEALGHKRYSHELLSHYLPAPILDFFQSRWIRIFQQGIIVEALKDSPYLLRTTDFKTMEDLHRFLENHTLKVPSEFLDNTEQKPIEDNLSRHDEIVFGLSSSVLVILISLHNAVQTSKKKVCGKARYWSELTAALVTHIEQRVHRKDIQSMLEQARSQAQNSQVEHLIYG